MEIAILMAEEPPAVVEAMILTGPSHVVGEEVEAVVTHRREVVVEVEEEVVEAGTHTLAEPHEDSPVHL